MESKTNNLYLGVSEHGGIIWYNPNHAYENYEKHRENNTQKCSNKSPLFLLHDIYRASCRSWIAITSPSAWEDVILSEALVNLGGAAIQTWPVIKHSNWKNGSTTYTVYVRMYVYICIYMYIYIYICILYDIIWGLMENSIQFFCYETINF